MLFSGDEVNKPVNVLSRGKGARDALKTHTFKNQMFLYLTIPTNHLDFGSIPSLNDGLKNFKDPSSLPVTTMSLFKLWLTTLLSYLKTGVIDRIDETYEFFRKC